jgi:hypothetical protein
LLEKFGSIPENGCESRVLSTRNRQFISGIEPILAASLLPAWARLGPLSNQGQGTALEDRRLIATVSAAIANQQIGMAVSRLDGRGVSLLQPAY